MIRSDRNPGKFEYDVALSFAREDRPYVEKVYDALTELGIRPFYDDSEKASLWGKDLYDHLEWVYQKAARYCVVFASVHYARNVWANHERRNAQARALQSVQEYILPARFDDTEIPGLRSTVAYVDLRSMTAEQLANLIYEKLFPQPTRAPAASSSFSTASEQSAVAAGPITGANYTTGVIRVQEWLRSRRVRIGAITVIVIIATTFILQAVLAAAPPENHTAYRSPGYKRRTLGAWAGQIEAVCRRMSPALNKDFKEMSTIKPAQLESSVIRPRIPQVLGQMYADYARTAALMQNVPPPSYASAAVNHWLNLFNSRGQHLYNAVQDIKGINDDPLERIPAAYDLEQYASQTNAILPLAHQLGVSACP